MKRGLEIEVMKMKMSIVTIFASFLAASGSSVQAATLINSSATGTLFYPNLQTILNVSTPKTAIVGDGVEFPAGFLIGNTLFSIDITSNQLIYRPREDVTYDPATSSGTSGFNGFVFSFLGAPTILGASVASSSNFNPVSLNFDSTSVTFDLKGLLVNTNSILVIDFVLADPTVVPLPAAFPLFAAGLGALGILAHRRKRKAVNT